MSGRTVGLAVALAAFAIVITACGAGRRYRVLPRNVRESVHRDYPDCRGRHVRGENLGGGRYRVVACGLDVVYACATGPHSRWRGCQMEGSGVVVAGAQPVGVVVVTTTGGEVPPAYTQPQVMVLETQPAPAQSQPPTVQAEAAPQQPAAAPSSEQVEGVIRQWLDSQRATILGCTQTQAALVEVSWTDAGVPTVALGGEMHGSPGESCVAQQLAGVQFQNVGRAGQLRHVIQ